MQLRSPALCLLLLLSALPACHTQPAASWQECEDTAGCSTWTFNGSRGHAQWSNGSIAELTIDKLDPHAVTIFRADFQGAVAGLRAIYTGVRTGNTITGTVRWSWPNHGAASTGVTRWHATLQPASAPPSAQPINPGQPISPSQPINPAPTTTASSPQLPPALSECEGDQCTRGGGGALWLFDGAHGEAMWHYGAVAHLTVRQFDGRTLILDRADPPGTYSSRWAGPDGWFRAHYTGAFNGNRIDGSVYFNGNVAHPGSWSATISPNLCSPGSACPLSIDQLQQLRQRASDAHLTQAVATSNHILQQSQQAQAEASRNTLPTPSNSNEICRSKTMRDAMQVDENQQLNDPGGKLLGIFACGLTGVCGDTDHPERMHPRILQSRPSSDGAGYTKNDPGSFLCQGLFSRTDPGQKVNLEVSQDADLATVLTKDAMDNLLQAVPVFEENFKVRPLPSGAFQLILIPGLTGITQSYSTQFTYP